MTIFRRSGAKPSTDKLSEFRWRGKMKYRACFAIMVWFLAVSVGAVGAAGRPDGRNRPRPPCRTDTKAQFYAPPRPPSPSRGLRPSVPRPPPHAPWGRGVCPVSGAASGAAYDVPTPTPPSPSRGLRPSVPRPPASALPSGGGGFVQFRVMLRVLLLGGHLHVGRNRPPRPRSVT